MIQKHFAVFWPASVQSPTMFSSANTATRPSHASPWFLVRGGHDPALGGSGSTTHALAWSLTLWLCQNSYRKWMKITIYSGFTYKKMWCSIVMWLFNRWYTHHAKIYTSLRSTDSIGLSSIVQHITRSLSAQHLSIWDTLTSHSYAVDHAETLVKNPSPRRPKKWRHGSTSWRHASVPEMYRLGPRIVSRSYHRWINK
jgi:hypothetical protein